MNRGIKIVIAALLIIVLYVVWIGLGSVLFGWTHGGGAIPTIIFILMATYVWKKITKNSKEKTEEKSGKEIDSEKKE